MEYGVTISYFTKDDKGIILPHTTHITGSKTKIFNAIGETMRREDFIDINVIIRKKR